MVHSTFYDWIPTFILGYLIVSIQVDFKYKFCNSHEDVLMKMLQEVCHAPGS
jgi:hypothetical protein